MNHLVDNRTGAAGVVGRNLLRHLLKTGEWDIVALSRRIRISRNRRSTISLVKFMADKGGDVRAAVDRDAR